MREGFQKHHEQTIRSHTVCQWIVSEALPTFLQFLTKTAPICLEQICTNNDMIDLSRRSMAGGFPSKLKVKKNKHVEEWNGKREILEKSFEMDWAKLPTVLFYLGVVPFGIYTLVRVEFQTQGDRRYKEMF